MIIKELVRTAELIAHTILVQTKKLDQTPACLLAAENHIPRMT